VGLARRMRLTKAGDGLRVRHPQRPDANPTTGESIDLLQVKQKNGASYDLLASYTYNDKHQVLTATTRRGRLGSLA